MDATSRGPRVLALSRILACGFRWYQTSNVPLQNSFLLCINFCLNDGLKRSFWYFSATPSRNIINFSFQNCNIFAVLGTYIRVKRKFIEYHDRRVRKESDELFGRSLWSAVSCRRKIKFERWEITNALGISKLFPSKYTNACKREVWERERERILEVENYNVCVKVEEREGSSSRGAAARAQGCARRSGEDG